MSVYPGAYTTYWNTRATNKRLVKPFILAGIHITGNSQLPSALQEAVYANRYGSNASFTFVTNRNGSVVQCLHPEWQVPWTNGSWQGSNFSLWTVQKAIREGYGANDSTFLTIENVGYPWGYPITNQQIEACARIIAWGSKVSGIGINRATVLGHRDYDGIGKYFCPTNGNLNELLNKIIVRANEIKSGTTLPDTSTSDEKLGGFPVKFIPVYNRKVVITTDNASLRTGPKIKFDEPNHNVIRKVGKGKSFNILGVVPGTKYKNAIRWYAIWLPKHWTPDRFDGRLAYIHRSDGELRKIER